MNMISQTYTFRDLPAKIRTNENGRRDSFINSIRKDMEAEFHGDPLNPRIIAHWMDVTGYDLHITFAVKESDARFLEIALHNLHQAKLLS